ncbi:MAG: DUF4031 domain-containing protein [Candidatus Brocadiales bacterium]
MPVYVDDMCAPFGRMLMCHMIADTKEELLDMADTIGVSRKWLQDEGNYREHFDISKGKRGLAIKAGAIEISWTEVGRKIRSRRTPGLEPTALSADPLTSAPQP